MPIILSGQAEAITEPKPSSLPDSLMKDLAPRIDPGQYKLTDELIEDLWVYSILIASLTLG